MDANFSIQKLLQEYDNILNEYIPVVENRFSKQNLFEYNEVLFAAHSCAIEGNSFSVNDTRELKEHGLKLKLHDKTMLEAFEILNHFKAYEFLLSQPKLPLSESLLIETHKILTQNTIQYTKGYAPGAYTDTQMAAGDTVFPDHEISIASVQALLEQTQKAITEKKVHPIEIAAKFHKYFIYLHPFPDGNGRLGRLFSNFILIKFNHPIVIITAEKREAYIDALKMSHRHQDLDIISAFFAETAISRMKDELLQIRSTADQGYITGKKSNLGLSFVF